MALPSSGAIRWSAIRTEFAETGAFGIGELRGDGCRPALPASGAISAGDFYSVVARSGQVTGGSSVSGGGYVGYYGYAELNAYYTHPAFGSISKSDLLVLGNTAKEIKGVFSYQFPAYPSPTVNVVTYSSTSSDGDFSNVGFTDVLPASSSTNTTYLRNKTTTTSPNSYGGRSTQTSPVREIYQWYTQSDFSTTPYTGLFMDYFRNYNNSIFTHVTVNPIVYVT